MTRSSRSKVDAHVHLWDTKRLSYPWLADVPSLAAPHRPDDLAEVNNAPESAIVVQAETIAAQAAAEVEWIRSLKNEQIDVVGVIAYAPLASSDYQEFIDRYARDPLVVGACTATDFYSPAIESERTFK